MEVAPHYLRFARAVALVGVVASPGCYQAHERMADAGPIDAFVPDVPPPDAPDGGPCARPLPCSCPTLGDPGSCGGPYAMCCPIVGPLAPPELRAA